MKKLKMWKMNYDLSLRSWSILWIRYRLKNIINYCFFMEIGSKPYRQMEINENFCLYEAVCKII